MAKQDTPALPKIVIQIPSDGGGSQAVAGKSETSPNEGGKSADQILKTVVSYGAIKGTADRLINYEIGTVSLRTGAQEYEQKLQFNKSVADRLLNTGIMVGTSLATGNLPMALISLATSAVSMGLDYAQAQNTLTLKREREDISIQMAYLRGGALNRRDRGE